MSMQIDENAEDREIFTEIEKLREKIEARLRFWIKSDTEIDDADVVHDLKDLSSGLLRMSDKTSLVAKLMMDTSELLKTAQQFIDAEWDVRKSF